MSDTTKFSEAKQALLEKYQRGELQLSATAVNSVNPRIKVDREIQRERVVPMQTTGSKRPFFFLHGQWNGGAFFCFSLARSLGSDQPFYVLDPYRFDGLAVPPTFEAIAAAHLKSLRTVQPEGPYLLGGWCNGGRLAYEMARQLYMEGQKVDLLILMDPVELVYPARLRLLYSAVRHLGDLLHLCQEKQLDWFLRLRHLARFPRQVYSYLRYPHYRKSKEFWRWGRDDYPGIYDWVALGYTPSNLYPDKITFFWSKKEPFRKGWRQVEQTNEVEVHKLAGVHMTCFAEHLSNLAEHLRTCLCKA